MLLRFSFYYIVWIFVVKFIVRDFIYVVGFLLIVLLVIYVLIGFVLNVCDCVVMLFL